MPPKPKYQHKPVVVAKPAHIKMAQVLGMLSSDYKKKYQYLFQNTDDRKFLLVYQHSCELLAKVPENTDALGFKGYAIYHMPLESFEACVNDFNDAEKRLMSKPQYALQACGMRIMQQAAKAAAGDTHLPLYLLANTYKYTYQFALASELFGQILQLPQWKVNANFAKDRALCTWFAGQQFNESYFNYALQVSNKENKIFCENCIYMLGGHKNSQQFFESAAHNIRKSNKELEKEGKCSFEESELSQLEKYKLCCAREEETGKETVVEGASGPAAYINKLLSAQILDVEWVNKELEEAYLQYYFATFDAQIIDKLENVIKNQLARNSDEIEQVEGLLACLLLRSENEQFVRANEQQIRNFDVVYLIGDGLQYQAIEIVKQQKLAEFQKYQLIVLIERAAEGPNLETLVRLHCRVNNARSLKILEELIDVPQHKYFIFGVVTDILREKPAKSLFCEEFLCKYCDVGGSVADLLSAFQCSAYTNHAPRPLDVDEVHLSSENRYFLEARMEPSALLREYKNERFGDEGAQQYYQAHGQQITQELMFLGDFLCGKEAQIAALRIATTLDPRDRFLNVKLCEKLAENGEQYNCLYYYQQFIARQNVFLTGIELQEQNVFAKLLLSPARQTMLYFIDDRLDYAEGAKNSEKVKNPRVPLPAPEFTQEEKNLIVNDEKVLKIVQMKIAYEMLQYFQDQMFDCQEQIYIAGYHWQLQEFELLLKEYNNCLLRRPLVKQAALQFDELVGYYAYLSKEELGQFIQTYKPLFEKFQQYLWAHHTMLDSIEYDRAVDYDPFCFELLKQMAEKGKMRVNKKVLRLYESCGIEKNQNFQ